MDDAAVAAQRAAQLHFIEHTLVDRIVATDPQFVGCTVTGVQVALQEQLDGFMSAIYNLTLTTTTKAKPAK